MPQRAAAVGGTHFGENLKRIRETRNLNQVQLAQLAGLTSQAVNQIESGKRWPRRETVKALAAALGCTMADLYGDAAADARPSDPATFVAV